MKKVWLIIPIFLVWFLSSEKQVESFSTHSKSTPPKETVSLPEAQLTQEKTPIPNERWGVQKYHEIQTESFDSPVGRTLVYSFSQNGVPIVGMSIRLKERSDGSIIEEENSYRPISEIPIHRNVLEEQATHLKSQSGRYQLDGLTADSLVILVREGLKKGELAFATSAVDKARPGVPTQLLIRSDDGKILRKSLGRKEF